MFDAWIIWVALGVICLIIEIFTPGFLFMSFGIGAIITGLISIISLPLWAQLAIFVVVTFVIFINLRKFSKKLTRVEHPTNVAALVGKKGLVIESVTPDKKGYVKVGGETWSALTEESETLNIDDKIVVQNIDGNKLIVKKTEE